MRVKDNQLNLQTYKSTKPTSKCSMTAIVRRVIRLCNKGDLNSFGGQEKFSEEVTFEMRPTR